jgi:hypothetical protein
LDILDPKQKGRGERRTFEGIATRTAVIVLLDSLTYTSHYLLGSLSLFGSRAYKKSKAKARPVGIVLGEEELVVKRVRITLILSVSRRSSTSLSISE